MVSGYLLTMISSPPSADLEILLLFTLSCDIILFSGSVRMDLRSKSVLQGISFVPSDIVSRVEHSSIEC